MGFGSYDESERQDEEIVDDGNEGVKVHENDHDGDVTFDSEESTDELVDRLAEIKENAGEDSDES